MRGLKGIDPGWGITAVRVAAALIFIMAGYTKFFVWGLPKVTENMAKYSLPAPGLFYAIGLAIAFFWVKLRMLGFAEGRLDLMLLGAGLLLSLAGPGRAAVDDLWLEKH